MSPRPIRHNQETAFFVRGPSPFARLVFFAAMSLTLMATDSRLHYLIEIRQGFIALTHPLQVLANAPSNMYSATRDYWTSKSILISENQRLTEQSLQQSVELQRYKTLETENEQLRKLLGAAQVSSQPAKLGEIMHMGRDPFTHKVVVNVGTRQDIQPGQAVVDESGVIGQVTRVYPFSSEVTLITDKELAIPIQIERNGLRAIAFGHGRDTTLDLPYLPANVDIIKGDRLVTSGIDGIYPIGLAVAEVIQIERTPDSPFAHIICKPIAGVENHRQILLLSIPKLDTPSGIGSNTSNTPPTTKPGISSTQHAPH